MLSRFIITRATDYKLQLENIAVGTILEIRNCYKVDSIDTETNGGVCITPKQYEFYNAACWELNTYSSFESYQEKIQLPLSLLIDTDYETIQPFTDIVAGIIFLRVSLIIKGEKYSKLEVKEVIDPKALWEYWFAKNTYSNPVAMQHIGLGEAVYKIVPIGKNYFFMNYICSCGIAACYNYQAWYIRNEESYTIGFVIANDHTMLLDSKDNQFDEEDYDEYRRDLKKQEEHNSKLAQIEVLLANSNENYTYDKLSNQDKAIYDEGTNTFNYPYTMELEPNGVYPPLLNDNEEIKYFNQKI